MSCKLEVINFQPHYMPGSFIDGKLLCKFSRGTHIENIKVRFSGGEFAAVKLRHENVFNTQQTICYSETVILSNTDIPKGKTTYTFKILIPHHLPSTYVSEYGRIKYDLEGVILLSTAKMITSQMVIDIFSPVDLKSFPIQVHKPARYVGEKEFFRIFGEGGHLTTTVQVDKRVFLCGESINLHVTINNKSAARVRRVKVLLASTASCKLADGQYIISNKDFIASTKSRANVKRDEEKVYKISLKIPEDFLIVNLNHSKLFKLKYWIHVYTAFHQFWQTPLEISFKVYIGHIPVNF